MAFLGYFHTLIAFLPQSTLLVLLMLYVPALAFFPQLLKQPLLFSAMPIVSYFILGSLSFILRFFNLFSHSSVILITLLFSILAALQLIQLIKNKSLTWSSNELGIVLCNFALIIPLIFFAITSAFTSDDALASWNYWAKLYFLALPTHEQHYPTFYPSFLAYAYQMLGSFEPQGIVKVLLAFFTFSLINAIAFSAKKIKENLLGFGIVILLVLMPGNKGLSLYHFYISGYADSILAATVAVSVALTMYYCETEQVSALIAAILAAMAAAWTKQPGMLWALIILPLILISKMIKQQRINYLEIIAIIFALAAPLIWLLGVGNHFYQAPGVLGASREHYASSGELSYGTVFLHSIVHYFLMQPTLLLLYFLAIFAAIKKIFSRIILFGLVGLGTVLWFAFASYDLREGFYVIAVCGVLIAQQNFFCDLINHYPVLQDFNIKINSKKYLMGMLIFFVLLATVVSLGQIRNMHGHIFPNQGSKTIIYHYFLDQPQWVYDNLYANKSSVVGGVTHYEIGLFTGQKNIVLLTASDAKSLQAQLSLNKVQFVLISPRISPSIYTAMTQLSQVCQQAVQLMNLGRSRAQYQVFIVKQQELVGCNIPLANKDAKF